MKTLKFKKIDAFTKGLSTGNPAGYIYMEPDCMLDENEMQRIAVELKGFVNEVGYISEQGNRHSLRYYSSECEVAFCGHATIAILYDLISNSRELLGNPELLINVQAGTLSVLNRIREEDAVYITAPAAKFLECRVTLPEIADALGTNQESFNKQMPLRIIDGGLRTLIVPLASLDICLDIYPDQEQLKSFCLENEIDIVHVFTKQTSNRNNGFRTRVFAPKYGYLEDPATGSGNAAFGYYLMDEKIWDKDFSIEQGPSRDNPNIIKLKRDLKDGVEQILFGGCGTTRIDGVYCLQDDAMNPSEIM